MTDYLLCWFLGKGRFLPPPPPGPSGNFLPSPGKKSVDARELSFIDKTYKQMAGYIYFIVIVN